LVKLYGKYKGNYTIALKYQLSSREHREKLAFENDIDSERKKQDILADHHAVLANICEKLDAYDSACENWLIALNLYRELLQCDVTHKILYIEDKIMKLETLKTQGEDCSDKRRKQDNEEI
jgi:hypothetical protein